MVLKTYCCQDLQAILKILEVNFVRCCCCCCYIISSTDNQLRSTIKLFRTKVCGLFVAAVMAFSVFFFCCFVGRKLVKSTFFRRFV